MAYTPKGYSSDMTDRAFRSFAKRQGMGQSEIDSYAAINPETGRRVFEDFKSTAESEKEKIDEKKATNKARKALTTPEPSKKPDRPLSREVISALADYGISGPRTYDEAFSHLNDYSKLLGYDSTPTKRNTSTEVTDEGEQVNARLAARTQAPKISGDDAALIDQAHTLHVITKGMAVHSVARGSTIQPSSTPFTPSGGQSEVVTEATRPDFTPRSGRPLVNLGPVPQPMLGSGASGQRKYQKELKERHELMARLSTEGRKRSSRTAELHNAAQGALSAGKVWTHDPDDGGWAYRDAPAPITPRKDL